MKYKPLDSALLGEEKEGFLGTIIMNSLIIVMVLFLLFVLSFQLCRVKGESMQPTLENMDDLLVTNVVFKYRCDDVVIIKMSDEDNLLVKRIVAVSGETFKFDKEDGYIYLYKLNSDSEFEKVPDSYIKAPMTEEIFKSHKHFVIGESYTLESGNYLFLGDNRNNSRDSRYYGYAAQDNIIGKVVLITKPNSALSKILNLIFNHSITENEA